MTRATLLLTAALALTAPATTLGGDVPDTSWAPDGARVRLVPDLDLPGWELYVVSRPPRTWGVARIEGRTVRGPAALKAAVAAAGRDDPVLLARLVAHFVDPGGTGQRVWTEPSSGRATAQQAIAAPPSLDGDTVVYWRFHHQTADMVRVTAHLIDGTVEVESGRVLLDAQDPRSPIERAREEIVADDLPTVRKGIARLVEHGEPLALQIVLDLAAHHQAAVVREAAVAALAPVRPDAGVAVVGERLRTDPSDEVRVAAARVLEAWADPASRPALEHAVRGDASPVVREIARQTLDALP